MNAEQRLREVAAEQLRHAESLPGRARERSDFDAKHAACLTGADALALLREHPDEHDLPTPDWYERWRALLTRAGRA